MIGPVISHIEAALTSAGVPPKHFKKTPEEVHRYRGPVPYAAIIPGTETLRRSVKYMGRETDPVAMVTKKRKRLYERVLLVSVLLAHKTMEDVEQLLESFVRHLGRGVYDDKGNWISIEIADAEWVDEASLNKQSLGYEFLLQCTGGIYEDEEVPVVRYGDVDSELVTDC